MLHVRALTKSLATAWCFTKGDWQNEVNVRDFIQKNYTPYEGDESFLAGATEATTTLWDKVMEGVKLENRTHAPVDFDTAVASTITSHDAGDINKQSEKIVVCRLSSAETCSYPVRWYQKRSKVAAKRTTANWIR
ncbi:pyruvate formate lyase family protein [Escherichia coli]